ncbi:dimethylargininase [Kitasatospora sp. NPDC001660]
MEKPVTRTPTRSARRHRFLMCRPTYFTVDYAINPWMDPGRAVDPGRALHQWGRLRALYHSLGHTVELVEPVPGLPDMVFTANAAAVVDGRVLVARFRHPQRSPESVAFHRWFAARPFTGLGFATRVSEGQGDLLTAGRLLLAGTGFRTEPAAHAEARTLFGRPVVTLRLVDPRFYHLDTALTVLDDTEVMYYPDAFDREARTVLRRLFPTALLATAAEAESFALNAVSDGRNVLLPRTADRLAGLLSARGFRPIGVDVSEFHKAGGGAKCCTLDLHGGIPARS